MSYRRWFTLGAVIAVVGGLVLAFGLLYGSFSPRGYVADRFTRAAEYDIGDKALAYTSTLPPSEVAEQVTRAWQPADQYVDASGIYLRYDDDSVVIRPIAAGSLILVERVVTAYPRYYHTVGNAWGWGRGTTVRGGGPGSGK
ncbi:MAG TPA: DUF4247 domain-containing protein [Micromonosporaceae bacterium]